MTTTTSTASLATGTTTSPAVSSSISMKTASNSTRITTTTSTSSSKSTKAPPNLPPGVQLLGHQYIMGQGTIPPFYGLQQPLYPNDYELLLQQRLPPLANYNYDMTFGVPTTLTSGREQNNLTNVASVPYSASENKMGRVEAQSPIPTTQQSTQSTPQQQHFINTIPYGYYYPQLAGIPNAAAAAAAAAAGFQYPATMFPMPPVTNTAHVGTTANAQFPESYGTHAYGTNKAYDELTQGTDFGKTTYVNQSQKVSAGTGSVNSVTGTGDIPGTAYGKSHTQPFEKQGFHHAGTPPPFNLPMATGTQAGPLGAPTTPYGAPFVPMMPPSQMLHPQLQQDSNSVSSRSHMHSQQSTTQAKASAPKAYANTYWGSN